MWFNIHVRNKSYWKWIVLLCVANFGIRLFLLDLPANFDEVEYFFGAEAILKNNLNPITFFNNYKTPVIFMPVVYLWKMFGVSRIWGRLIIYIFSSITIFFTYLLGKKINGEKVGLVSALLLTFTPLFMMQSLVYQDPVPLTAFLVMTIYFFLVKKYGWYLISATLMVLTKEISALIPVIIFLYSWSESGFSFKKIIESSRFLLPLIPFIVWMILNKQVFGWYLLPYHMGLFGFRNLFTPNSIWFLNCICVENFMWIFLTIILIGFLYLYKTKNREKSVRIKNYVLFLAIPILYFIILSSYKMQLPRYLLFVLPLILILVSNFLFIFFEKKIFWLIVFNLLILLIVSNLFNLLYVSKFDNGDRDLRLFSNINLNKQIVEYVENNYDNPVVITVRPLNYFFNNQFYGYSRKDLDVEGVTCDDIVDLSYLENKFPDRKLVAIYPKNICQARARQYPKFELKKILGLKMADYFHDPVYIYEKKLK